MSPSTTNPGRRMFDATVKPVYARVRDTANQLLERHHGIETVGVIELEELGLAGAERERYKPTEWLTLPRVLRRREVGPDDVFIDFGSGLGRVVYQAALRYPFKRVIGVELSAQLNEIAERNLARNVSRLRCQSFLLVTRDVLDYDIPDDVTVAFFANPFRGDTFMTVIDRLLASIDRKPRTLRVIYRNPVEHERLEETGRFRVARRLRGMRPGREWSRSNSTVMYAAAPSPSSAGAARGGGLR
jgi:Histone methylation protein DOT1